MDTPITLDQEILECPIIQPKETRACKDYVNTLRIHSERVKRLQKNNKYDSASEDCSHWTKKDAKNNQKGNSEIPSNALEVLMKILSIP